jgi:uncharacterized protein CbrC (UPF0167 family)
VQDKEGDEFRRLNYTDVWVKVLRERHCRKCIQSGTAEDAYRAALQRMHTERHCRRCIQSGTAAEQLDSSVQVAITNTVC